MTTFLDGKPAEALRRRLFFSLLRSRRHWHNRQFTASQSMETTADGRTTIHWPGHGELIARPLTELPPTGNVCSILASGPSVTQLEAIERLFEWPTACVNGSVAIAHRELLMFGVDLNNQGRCYREEKASPSHLDETYSTLILPSFELVAAYCQQTGKKLINCSLGSRLPDSVIPKQDGADVLDQLAAGQSRLMAQLA